MWRLVTLILLCGCFIASGMAQNSPPESNQAPPRSDRDKAEESSSRDTRIDLSPPKDDAKEHPNSAASLADEEGDDASADVQEFRPWDPHKAMKDIEVGDFYFKKKNYRAALDRYREALVYKPNDALANFHMAQCLEKLDKPEEARTHYEEYLKIMPHGPLAGEAKTALEKLKQGGDKGQTSQKAQLKH
jgi:tetratricopeptide (TPR) repeat protein